MLRRPLSMGQTGEGLVVQTRDLLLLSVPVFPAPTAPPSPLPAISPCSPSSTLT